MPTKLRALVTGGSSGLGAVVVRELLAKGWQVEVWSRQPGQANPKAEGRSVDLSLPDHCQQALAALEGDFDLVVNAAGGATPRLAGGAADAQEWQLMYESPRQISLALMPGLVRRGGVLVNVSSLAVDFPLPYMASYNAAKAALSAFNTFADR
jgi:uncharacterized protein